jgi:hypothetical protein
VEIYNFLDFGNDGPVRKWSIISLCNSFDEVSQQRINAKNQMYK